MLDTEPPEINYDVSWTLSLHETRGHCGNPRFFIQKEGSLKDLGSYGLKGRSRDLGKVLPIVSTAA
jgi:hypothetical protein